MHPLRTQAPLTDHPTPASNPRARACSTTQLRFPHFSAPLTPTYSRGLTQNTPRATSF